MDNGPKQVDSSDIQTEGIRRDADHADVIIIGAGPAGSATAWHLARAGISTLLLDKSDFPRDKVCGDGLSPRAQRYLARMGLLDIVAADAHQAPRIRFQAPGGAPPRTMLDPLELGALLFSRPVNHRERIG